jgi:hypothetical protein
LMAAQHLRPLPRHNTKAQLLSVDSPTELHIVFKLREQMVLERDCRRNRSPLHLPPNTIIRTFNKKIRNSTKAPVTVHSSLITHHSSLIRHLGCQVSDEMAAAAKTERGT